MTEEELKTIWKREEDCALIQGWDFSHIHGRYQEEDCLPWDYKAIIRSVLKDEIQMRRATRKRHWSDISARILT